MVSIEDAHSSLLKSDQYQFEFPDGTQPSPPHDVMGESIAFHWGGSGLGWTVVGVAGILALAILWRAIRRAVREPAGAPIRPATAIPAAVARASLVMAEGLAAEGRFAEAVHALLTCAIDEIGRRYPDLLRPATTSRDLIERGGLPDTMRSTFGVIAATVEKGIFGNRGVTLADFATCRDLFTVSILERGS